MGSGLDVHFVHSLLLFLEFDVVVVDESLFHEFNQICEGFEEDFLVFCVFFFLVFVLEFLVFLKCLDFLVLPHFVEVIDEELALGLEIV